MDSNITSLPSEPHLDAAAHPRASLPGEAVHPVHPHLDTDPLGRPDTPAAPRSHRRGRSLLLASVALLSLVAAGGVFLVSPYNTLLPVDTARLGAEARQLAASAGISLPPVVAPAAKLATAPRREVKPPVREEPRPATPGDQAAEILSLHKGISAPTSDVVPGEGRPDATRVQLPARPAPPSVAGALGAGAVPAPGRPATGGARPLQAAPASAVVTPVSPAPEAAPAVEVGLASQVPVALSPAAFAANLTQTPAEPVSLAPAPADRVPPVAAAALPLQPSKAPGDAVEVAVALRPAPLARGDQIDVLHAVAQLGIIMRDLRAQNLALRASVQASTEKLDGAVADFERRLALAEARGALNAAMGADPSAAVAVPASATTAPASRTVHLSGGAAPQPAGVRPQAGAAVASTPGPRRYKVQAASPGLAMLSELDRSGGEGSQLQVGVGDQVPGYGRVTAIQQRGSTWLVQTDRGAIQ